MADTALTNPFSFAGVTGAGLSPNIVVDLGEFYFRNVELVQSFHTMLGLRGVMIGQQGVMSTRFGNVDHPASFAMEDLTSEPQEPSAVGQTLGYDSITVAPRGLAMVDTYDKVMFATPQLVNDTGVMSLLKSPGSPVLAKLGDLVAAALAGISAVSGTTTTALSIDTLIEAIASFNQTYVADGRILGGAPKWHLHSKQVTQAQASARTEPGWQGTGTSMNIQGLIDKTTIATNWLGLGADLYVTDKVTTASGAHQGALYDPGAVITGFGDPSPLLPKLAESGLRHMAMPELGLLLQQDPTTTRARQITYQLFTYIGAAMGDTTVGRQRRIQSVI